MLKPDTVALWNRQRSQPLLRNFILIGGSALTLRIGHRLSEDLNLLYLGPKLPREQLTLFVSFCEKEKLVLRKADNPADLDEFLLAGEDLDDYQQDFVADGKVRLSLFVADREMLPFLKPGYPDSIRLAETEEVFRLKCLVSAKRSKTRDWLDLYLLLTEHTFSIMDYHETFHRAGIPEQLDLGLTRLCSGQAQKDDEGCEALMPDPPDLATMTAYFQAQRDLLELSLARKAFAKPDKIEPLES